MDKSHRGAFSYILRRRRTQAGLTQQELAERSGISIRSISDLERAVNERPHRETADMLADGLGLLGEERQEFLEVARPRPRAPRTNTRSYSYPTLPEPSGQLVGREQELQSIETLLLGSDVRLLTLTGPGGVGKTRLAIEAAHRIADGFPNGVLFVRLDGLLDPDLVLPALAGALHLLDTGGALSLVDRLAAHLETQQLLIVLDNLEHLLAAAPDLADLSARLLQTKIVVTSRESLRVRGEHVITVAPLARPHPVLWQASEAAGFVDLSPAMELFLQHACAADPELSVDPGTAAGHTNLALIAETCHRLDGLPLAIELAAAQSEVLSPAAILTLLKNAGLPLLAAGDRDQPSRLQTMDAAIAWSYNLLPEPEQALFRALSVFAGGFTFPAAAAVSGFTSDGHESSGHRRDLPAGLDPTQIRSISAEPALDLVAHQRGSLADVSPALLNSIRSLAHKHLIVQDSSIPDHIAPRFRMLEPLRLFGLDRLRAAGEEPEIRRRHVAFFANLVERLDALTLGSDPEVWLEQQLLDLDNVRAALDWAHASGEDDLAVRITASIAQLWLIKGLLPEGRQRVSRAIAVDTSSAPSTRWFLRFWAGSFALDGGDIDEATRYAHELLEIAETDHDQIGLGVGLTLLSRAIGAGADRHEEAAGLARQAVETLAPLGQGEWTGWAWSRLGIEYHHLGRLTESRDCQLHSLDIRRKIGCEGCASYTLASLGAVELDLDQPAAAVAAYGEALELTVKHENQTLILSVLLGLADTVWQYSNGPEGVRAALLFFGAAEAVRRQHGIGGSRAARNEIVHWQTPMRRALGDEAVDALIGEGMDMPLGDVVTLTLGLALGDRRLPVTDQGAPISLFAAFGSVE